MTTHAQRVSLENVAVDYGGGPVVSDLDLAIEPGEIAALLGQSGCGKSTTLRVIAGLVTPTAGTVRFGGEDVTLMPPWRRNLGLVFQNHALFPHLTVARNIEYGLRRRMPKPQRRDRVAEMLELVGLQELAEFTPAQLSGGQSQRAALARALAPDPKILLLDEPFSALDANLRDRMRSEVERIIRLVGVTTVMVTHDQDEAMSMADRVAVMADGQILEVDVPDKVFREPRYAYTAQFVGASNLVSGHLVGMPDSPRLDLSGLTVAVSPPRAEVGPPYALAIKPEDIVVENADTASVSVDARLVSSKFHGAVRDLVWEVPALGGRSLRVRVPAGAAVGEVGEMGRIGWDVERAIVVHDPDGTAQPRTEAPAASAAPAEELVASLGERAAAAEELPS